MCLLRKKRTAVEQERDKRHVRRSVTTANIRTASNSTSSSRKRRPDRCQQDQASLQALPSDGEVDGWLSRITEITTAVDDFLKEDPVAAAEKRTERERQREAQRALEARQRVAQRYDTKNYVRFENDELINKLLAEVDKPEQQRPPKERFSNATDFELISVREAERMKTEGNAAFAASNWAAAHEKYSLGIGMEPLDKDLIVALHNNRAVQRRARQLARGCGGRDAGAPVAASQRQGAHASRNGTRRAPSPTRGAGRPAEGADSGAAQRHGEEGDCGGDDRARGAGSVRAV